MGGISEKAATEYLSTEKVRYSYRLRPSKTASAALVREDGCNRWLWNNLVDYAAQSRNHNTPVTGKLLESRLTQLRHETPWLKDGSQNTQQQTVRNYLLARKHAYEIKGRRYPKFKSKHRSLPSLNYTRNGFSLKPVICDDGVERIRLRLAGGILIPVVWSRELPSQPTSARVTSDACGDWWVSFVVERPKEDFGQAHNGADSSIGIDWGLTVLATTTDSDYDLMRSRHGKEAQAKLTKYQRRMARRKPARGEKSSPGYKRAKRDAARVHRKVARKRTDDARKWARRVVIDHQHIADENFKPKFMASNRSTSRASADASIGQLRRCLAEYAGRAGRNHVLVNPANTTQTCSNCLVTRPKHDQLKLHHRFFECHSCGHAQDRDKNAARVILVIAGINDANADGCKPDRDSRVTSAA